MTLILVAVLASRVAPADEIYVPTVTVTELGHLHQSGNDVLVQDAAVFPCGSQDPTLFGDCSSAGFWAAIHQGDVVHVRFAAPTGERFRVFHDPAFDVSPLPESLAIQAHWSSGLHQNSASPVAATITFESLTGTAPVETYSAAFVSDAGGTVDVRWAGAVVGEFTFTAITASFLVSNTPPGGFGAYGFVRSEQTFGPGFATLGLAPGGTPDRLLMQLEPDPSPPARQIAAWGYGAEGQTTVPIPLVTGAVDAVAAGGSHSCAIQGGGGAVICWGNGSLAQSTPPASVNGELGTASAVAAGSNHSCAIQSGSDAVVCWGGGFLSQNDPPDSVNGVAGTADAIAAGFDHSCAIQTGTGAVVCWGRDDYGQSSPPPSVNGAAGTATAIATGSDHSCAIQSGTGAVVCWGANIANQASPPPSVNGTSGTATAISAGLSTSCAIQSGSSAVVCWGSSFYGETSPPSSVNGVAGTASAIAAGNAICAIQSGTGAVVCWGYAGDGQTSPPASVDGVHGRAIAIAAGGGHSLAIHAPQCSNGLDDDGDGLADHPDDPGCTSAADLSEREPTLPCDDGADNDGDGLVDFRLAGGDPACQTPVSLLENPGCDDGVDNDGDGGTDWDGGGTGTADSQCVDRPWRDREGTGGCGIGAELALLLAGLAALRRTSISAR